MTLEQIYSENTEWEDRLTVIRENLLSADDEINEYRGKRDKRDTQVGKRADKKTKTGKTIPVNKIAIPFQKHIVRSAASYLFGEPVHISSEDEIDPLLTLWEDLDLDSVCLKMCEQAKAFKASAVLFRIVSAEVTEDGKNAGEQKLKLNILDPRKGNLIPIWSAFDELDGFVWETEVEEQEENYTLVYIYDDTTVTVLREDNDGITVEDLKPHGFDRIPVVLVQEDDVEYEDVKPLIDRFEMMYSKFADTNDYFASPKFKAKGSISDVPQQDDTGTVYMMDVIETDKGTIIESDLDLLTWDSAPEATRMEFELAKNLIMELSSTTDLSNQHLKGIGNLSGVALRLMFLASEIKTKFSMSTYRKMVKRIISLLIVGGSATKYEGVTEAMLQTVFKIEFQSFTPTNTQEMVSMLSEATFGKAIMSQESAIKKNPLVDNPSEELEKVQGESSEGGETMPI